MKDNKNRRPTHALCFLADEDLLHSPDYESLSSIHSASLRNALFNFIHYKIEEILSDTKDREFDKQVQIENEFTETINNHIEEQKAEEQTKEPKPRKLIVKKDKKSTQDIPKINSKNEMTIKYKIIEI